MRIAIDAGNFRPGANVRSGIERIIDSFIRKAQNRKDIILDYYFFDSGKKSQSRSGIFFKRLPRRFFASVFLPTNLTFEKPNAFIGFSANLPFFIKFLGFQKIVFLYDLGFLKFPQFYSNAKKMIRQVRNAIIRADKIIVLTDSFKEELLLRFPKISRKKIVRIYPGLDHLKKVRVKSSVNSDEKYFLYVGVIKPIKNIQEIFKCFYGFLQQSKAKDCKLILIGEKEQDYFAGLQTDKYYRKIKKHISFLGNVSDSELAYYYRNATGFLNFSFAEGFAFPVLEAASLGKPVIVSDLPIYREFKKYFKNLLINNGSDEVVKNMLNVSSRTNYTSENDSITSIFSWSVFTWKLLEEIKLGKP